MKNNLKAAQARCCSNLAAPAPSSGTLWEKLQEVKHCGGPPFTKAPDTGTIPPAAQLSVPTVATASSRCFPEPSIPSILPPPVDDPVWRPAQLTFHFLLLSCKPSSLHISQPPVRKRAFSISVWGLSPFPLPLEICFCLGICLSPPSVSSPYR